MSQGRSAVDEGPSGEGHGPALQAWILPVAGLAAAGLVAAGYLLGFLGDRAVATVASLAFGAALAIIALRAGFERASSRTRAAVAGYAALMVAVGLYPAYQELAPGEPSVEGRLGSEQRSLALPSGGAYRLVVSAPLSGSREARVAYRLKVGGEALDGVLERVTTYQRVRRGGAMPVAEDHNVSAHELTVPDGAPRVELDSVTGEATGVQLTVRAYRVLPPWLVVALTLLMLAAGTFLEGRLSARGALSMSGAAAALFGVLLKTTDPASVLGPVLGSALLAAGGGALAGSVLGSIGRKLFAPKEGAPVAGRRPAVPGARAAKAQGARAQGG